MARLVSAHEHLVHLHSVLAVHFGTDLTVAVLAQVEWLVQTNLGSHLDNGVVECLPVDFGQHVVGVAHRGEEPCSEDRGELGRVAQSQDLHSKREKVLAHLSVHHAVLIDDDQPGVLDLALCVQYEVGAGQIHALRVDLIPHYLAWMGQGGGVPYLVRVSLVLILARDQEGGELFLQLE